MEKPMRLSQKQILGQNMNQISKDVNASGIDISNNVLQAKSYGATTKPLISEIETIEKTIKKRIEALLKELINAKGIGVDKSSKAITIAKKNSISQKVDNRALFKNVNLEEIKFDKKFDLIVSNPPYLPDVSLKNLNSDIKLYEPKIALQGGVQGVDFLYKIIDLASKILKINGLLGLEIGDNQFQHLLTPFEYIYTSNYI